MNMQMIDRKTASDTLRKLAQTLQSCVVGTSKIEGPALVAAIEKQSKTRDVYGADARYWLPSAQLYGALWSIIRPDLKKGPRSVILLASVK